MPEEDLLFLPIEHLDTVPCDFLSWSLFKSVLCFFRILGGNNVGDGALLGGVRNHVTFAQSSSCFRGFCFLAGA